MQSVENVSSVLTPLWSEVGEVQVFRRFNTYLRCYDLCVHYSLQDSLEERICVMI